MSAPKKILAHGSIKQIDAERRRISGIASHQRTDREGDLLPLDRLDTGPYDNNSVLQAHHDRTLVIGRVTRHWIEMVDGAPALLFEAEGVPPGVSARADEVWGLIQAGALRGVSIGFIAHEIEPMPSSRGIVFTRAELLEISVVSLPACASCLLQNKSACSCGHADDAIIVLDAPTGGVPGLVPGWLTDARRLLAAGVADNPDPRFDAVRHAIQDIDSVIDALVDAATGRATRRPVRRHWSGDDAWLAGGRDYARRYPSRHDDDVVLVLRDSPSDVINVDVTALPELIATSLRDGIGPVIQRETRRALDQARGRITDD